MVFTYKYSNGGGNDVATAKHPLAASLDLVKGTALSLEAGKLAVAGTTEVVRFILAEDAETGATGLSPTTGLPVFPPVIPVTDDKVFECAITPELEEAATGGSTTTVTATEATTDNDYDGGTIYINELNAQRVIDDSQETGGTTTFTFIEPVHTAVTSSMSFKAVPFAQGDAVKLNTTGTGLDTDVGDETGGKLAIEYVDLLREVAGVRFLQA